MLDLREQYNHPLWQKKKYEIYNRDGFTCQACNKDCYELQAQLHAHHVYYKKNLLIWEYDDESLVTLCADCHYILHEELAKISGIIGFKMLTGRIDVCDLKIKSDG